MPHQNTSETVPHQGQASRRLTATYLIATGFTGLGLDTQSISSSTCQIQGFLGSRLLHLHAEVDFGEECLRACWTNVEPNVRPSIVEADGLWLRPTPRCSTPDTVSDCARALSALNIFVDSCIDRHVGIPRPLCPYPFRAECAHGGSNLRTVRQI